MAKCAAHPKVIDDTVNYCLMFTQTMGEEGDA